MTITFDVTPETEDRLQQEAARSGIAVSDLVRQLVETRFSSVATPTDDWEALLLQLPPVAQGTPLISSESLRRKNLYEDRA